MTKELLPPAATDCILHEQTVGRKIGTCLKMAAPGSRAKLAYDFLTLGRPKSESR